MKKNDYRILALRMIEYLKDRPNHLATKREIADHLGCKPHTVKTARLTLIGGMVVPIPYCGYFLRGQRDFEDLTLEEMLLVVRASRDYISRMTYAEEVYEMLKGFYGKLDPYDDDAKRLVEKQEFMIGHARGERMKQGLDLLGMIKVMQDKYDYTPRWFVE